MKKKLYILMAFMAVTFGFTACSDDDGGDGAGVQHPEEEVAGTYYGTWEEVVVNTGTSEEISRNTTEGTITISPNRQWVVNITLNVAAPIIEKEETDVANCSGNSERGYTIVNPTGGVLSESMYGDQVIDGNLTLSFSETTTQAGRPPLTLQTTRTFTGKKQ